MLVTDIRVDRDDEFCELKARVESEANPNGAFWFAPFHLWYRFPLWCEPILREDTGDPFLAALLLPAMMCGERLALPAPVSPRLLRQLEDIQDIHISFDPRLKPLELEAPAPDTSPPNGVAAPATGLFFSLGVDSFYSLLKRQRNPRYQDDRITHLIAIHGFHEPHGEWDNRFPPQVFQSLNRVAVETGAQLLPVATNVRLVTAPLARWNMSHGAALASVALALDGLFARVSIAASTTYDQLYPWGSHPVLDPLWSTERLTFVHDGCEMGRIDKVRFIARFPLVLDTLRVCPGFGGSYNCGRCIKCLPTMIDVMQAGVWERCQTFPADFDVAALRELLRAFAGQLNVDNYRRRLAQLDDAAAPPGLREALSEYLAAEAGTAPSPPQSAPAPKRLRLPRFFTPSDRTSGVASAPDCYGSDA